MKIAMIGHKRIPSREGGIEVVVQELSRRLVAMGHTVDAYNRRGGHVSGDRFGDSARLTEWEGVRLISVPTFQGKALNAVVYSFLATVRALFGRYDVIHFHAEGPSAMCRIAKWFGIRTVCTIHGLDWQRAKWGRFAKAYLLHGERTAAKCADVVVVLSETMGDYFKKTYGRETVCIPNGVEKAQPVSVDPIARQYGLEKDGYILYVGRIVPEKGLHRLIAAFRGLATDKRLVIAGGSSHSDEYVRSVEALAEGDARIVFTGFVQGDTLASLYSNAYVYVLPSDVEGMPLTLLEAMSYGNCCLVSDLPELREVAEDAVAYFAREDQAALGGALAELLEDEARVTGLKEGAAGFVCGKYDWGEVVLGSVGVYGRR